MLILPFIHGVLKNTNKNNTSNTSTTNNFQVNIIKILTIGGNTIWEEDNSLHIDNDILNPNDIYRKKEPIKYDGNLHLCEVDTDKTNVSGMYNWNECDLNDSDTFCWRTFYYFTNNTSCWLESPDNEKLGNYSIKKLINVIISSRLTV
jgi:hypothetical protein